MSVQANPALSVRILTKSYAGVLALDGVDLDIREGEVHALLGANGAGKSTLVKLLSGNITPDKGTVVIGGEPRTFTSPHRAFEAGIATVHQELSLFEQLTVAQNILIGREERSWLGFLREDISRDRTECILKEIGAPEIRAEAKVGTLSLAQRQIVEIAKAISFDPKVVILDEPTSALGLADVRRLLKVVDGLRARGRAILFISHRMEEIETIADTITILRSGKRVGHFERRSFSRERALELMLGESRQQLLASRPPIAPAQSAPVILKVKDLRLQGSLQGVSFELRAGEILGFAGLEGQGQREMLFSLFGLFRRGLSGEVNLRGRSHRAKAPGQAIKAGFAFIPDDRKNMGGFMFLPVKHNISIAMLGHLSRFLLMNFRLEKKTVNDLINRLAVKSASARVPLNSLSGGNQQKVIAAKWLVPEREIYLFCDPTRGVDAGAREMIYATIRDLAASGKGIIIYSTDMVEFSILCSRVLVFRGGKIAGCVENDQITEESILSLSFLKGEEVAA